MTDRQAGAVPATARPRAASHDQLASPPLSPILELDTDSRKLPNSSENAANEAKANGNGFMTPSPSRPVSRKPSLTANESFSPKTNGHETGKALKLSPNQMYELASTPGSLPLRAADAPTEDIPSLAGTLGSPLNNVPSRTSLTSPYLSDPNDPVPASGDESSSAISPVPSPFLPQTVPGMAPVPPNRPRPTVRSATSPALKRRESSSATRNPKTPSGDGLRSRKPSLTRLKTGDDIRDAPGSARSQISPITTSVPLPPLSLSTYLQLELSSDRPSALYIDRPISSDYPYEPSSVKFERLLNFLVLPHQLEQVLWFGTLACLDAWLYSLTILPLRFMKALFLFLSYATKSLIDEFTMLSRFVAAGSKRLWHRKRQGIPPSAPTSRRGSEVRATDVPLPRTPPTGYDIGAETIRRRQMSSRAGSFASPRRPGLSTNHKADLLHGLLIITSCLLLNRFDASRMYHSIRGQAAIKLYVIYNVLEVCDRLFAALGQDVLECLFSKETLERRPNGEHRVIRRIWMFALALVYNVIHATMLFYQVVTLNVAVNSYSNALLTLLMSNQFVEIKGTVFKKFEKESLFQLTCADVVERFQLWLMLSIIASRNIVEVGGLSNLPTNPSAPPPTTGPATSSLLPAAFSLLPSLTTPVLTPFLIVLGSEMLVDWLKHAYINKFNSVKPSLYGRFLDVLAKDYYTHAFADQNLTKRIGLPTLPLTCLVLRAAVQVWGMFAATALSPSSVITSSSLTLAPSSAATGASIARLDEVFRQALGRSSFAAGQAGSPWSMDDGIALATLVVLVLLIFLFLLAFKLVLGMALLAFARRRYRGMKEREREGHDTHSRRVGGWGVTEVDDEKRKVIYDGDDAGLQRAREREARTKDPKTGVRLEGVNRYMMAAKRIW